MGAAYSQKIFGAIGTAGSLVASLFLNTPRAVYGLIGFAAASACLGSLYMRQWQESQPNEWLLVIENGKLVKSGIGLKCFVWPTQTVVTFPSAINRVPFSAQNVSKEMQGLEVTGFAIWSVHRGPEGPFKCYKYTQGCDANLNVQTMCESIVRHQIANHSLQQVLTSRNILRDSMKEDLQKQLTGWGIWLETVEITEVKICSTTLFEDMQAEYKQETHLKAEQIRLESQRKDAENQLQSEFALNKSKMDTETQRIKFNGDQQLRRQQQEAELYKKKCDLDIQKLKKDEELQKSKINMEAAVEALRKQKEQQAQEVRKEFDLKMFALEVEAHGKMNPTALQKYIVDSTERIYNRLPIKEISINQYTGPENTSNISSLLPGIGMIQQQHAQALNKAK